MQIRVAELNTQKPKTITLTGEESWLKSIAANLNETSDHSKTNPVTGSLTLRMDSAGFVHGTGMLFHEVLRICGRCSHPTSFPLNADVSVRWRPPFTTHVPRDISLTAEDLDVYFIENDRIDIEQVVLDTLQCALPDVDPAHADATDPTQICEPSADEVSEVLVYSDEASGEKPQEPEKVSPFAVLKDLKL